MVDQPGANVYTQGFGSRPENVEVPHLDTRAPASTDIQFPIGKRWVDTTNNHTYTLTSQSSAGGTVSSTWTAEGSGSSALSTLSGDTGTATPSSGNIEISGTANQITTAASGAIVTASLPAAITAPGSLTTTTTLTAGTGFTITTGGGTLNGTIRKPTNPAFMGFAAAALPNKTGNGANYQLGTDALTVAYDLGTNFNSNGTFTAPVDGVYDLRTVVYFTNCTTAAAFTVTIQTSSLGYVSTFERAASADSISVSVNALAFMQANDTAVVVVAAAGEAGNTVALNGSPSDVFTAFSGFFVG